MKQPYLRRITGSIAKVGVVAFAPSTGIANNPTAHSTMEGVMRRSKFFETPAFDVLDTIRALIRSKPRFTGAMAVMVVAALLTACGGGSSSGGGGSGNQFAGTYNGFATLTLSAPGVPPETISGTIRIVVDDRGNVTTDPGSSAPGAGRLNGNSFTATVPGAQLNEPGLTCTGSILVKGTLSGDNVTGTHSGNALVCNGIPIQVNGTYSATRPAAGAASRAPVGTSVMEALQESIGTAR